MGCRKSRTSPGWWQERGQGRRRERVESGRALGRGPHGLLAHPMLLERLRFGFPKPKSDPSPLTSSHQPPRPRGSFSVSRSSGPWRGGTVARTSSSSLRKHIRNPELLFWSPVCTSQWGFNPLLFCCFPPDPVCGQEREDGERASGRWCRSPGGRRSLVYGGQRF